MTGSFFNRAAAMARQRNLQEEQTSGSAARKNRDTVPCLIAHNAGASNAGKTKMLCAENV
jgi:hypothetical protein